MVLLTNRHLTFHLNPQTGYWHLAPSAGEWPRLEEARLGAIYTVDVAGQPRWVYWDGELVGAEVETLNGVPTSTPSRWRGGTSRSGSCRTR